MNLSKRNRPITVDEKIKIPEEYVLISKTDPKGIITEGNKEFIEISGYSSEELIGSSHNLIRHPDMPMVMFKLVWERIKDKENIMAIIKNLSKDGRYYWVVTDFVTQVDIDRKIIDYTAYRRPVCDEVINEINKLYAALLAIENLSGIEDSAYFLQTYFERRDTNYDDYIEDLMINNCNKNEMKVLLEIQKEGKELSRKEKRSLFSKFFRI